jgi:hypothetical protein
VIAGLARMNSSTLHLIEHGQRPVTLSEIVALANALETAPSGLVLPVTALRDQVAQVHTQLRACQFAEVATDLPGLIRNLHNAWPSSAMRSPR